MIGRRRQARQEIGIGQRFRKPGSGVWEVIGLSRDIAGHLHVRLRRLDNTWTEKTIAASMLNDPREYEPQPSEE